MRGRTVRDLVSVEKRKQQCSLCGSRAGEVTLMRSVSNRVGAAEYVCFGGCKKQLQSQIRRLRKSIEKEPK